MIAILASLPANGLIACWASPIKISELWFGKGVRSLALNIATLLRYVSFNNVSIGSLNTFVPCLASSKMSSISPSVIVPAGLAWRGVLDK